MIDLGYAFNAADDSDILLVYKASKQQAEERAYHAHKVLLKQSDLLRGKLTWPAPEQQHGGAMPAAGAAARPGPRPRLEVEVEPELLQATELVTRWLYCGALPATPVPNTTLLASYRLASYLGVPSCAAACAAVLARLEPDDINDALLRAAFDLPAALRESRALARVMAACTQRLMSEFDDVSGTVSDGVQKERFCGLPHAAVLTWLKAVDLEACDQGCALLLLGAWVDANESHLGREHLEQLEALARRVQALSLSPACVHGLLAGAAPQLVPQRPLVEMP